MKIDNNNPKPQVHMEHEHKAEQTDVPLSLGKFIS